MTRTIRRKRRLIAAGAVLAFLVVAAGTLYLIRDSVREQRSLQSREAGLAAHQEGNYAEALEQLSYFLRRNREDVQVLLAFADSRAKVFAPNNRHLATAVQVYNLALSVDPENEIALGGLLHLYERLGRQVEWMDTADRLLAKNPENVDALRLKVIGHYRNSQFDASGDYLVRLMAVEPTNMQWRAMHLQLLQQQDQPFDSLLRLCEQWIASHDGDGRFHMMKARLYVSAGRLAEAQSVARDAAARGADSADILPLMLAMLDSLQLRDDADDLVAATVARFADAQWPREQAVRRHWQASRLQRAMEEIEVTAEVHGSLDRSLLRWKSLLLMTAGEHDKARDVLQQMADQAEQLASDVRDSDRAWVAAMRARMDLADNDWPQIINALQTAIAVAPNDAVLHYLTGEAYLFLNEYELASLSFERASLADPHWYMARLSYAHALLGAGKPGEARDMLIGMLQRGEGGIVSYVLFARAWLAAGEPTDAIRGIIDNTRNEPMRLVDMLERVYQARQDDDVLQVLIRAALRYDRDELALQLLQDALVDDAISDETMVALARISLENSLGLEEQFIARAQSSLGLTPEVALVASRIEYRKGRTEAGLKLIDDAFESRPDIDEQLRMRASYLCEVGHPYALDALKALLDRPHASGANATLVLSQDMTWQHPDLANRAIEQLADVVGEESPRVVLARGNYVLRFQTDRPDAIAKAQVQVNDLLQIVPESLAARSVMAFLCLAGNPPETEQAIRHLERAIASHPRQGDLYIRLIGLLQQQGDYTLAEDYLARFSAMAGTQEHLHAELQLLEQQGNFEAIVARLSQNIDGSSSEAEQLMLFAGLQRAGRLQEAERLVDSLLRSPQRSELTVRLAAEFYGNTGQFEKGLELIRSHEYSGGEPANLVAVGRYYQANGFLKEAMQSFESAHQRNPNYIDAIVHIASLHGASGRHEDAYRMAMRGLQQDPSNESLQAVALSTSLLLGSTERARARQLMVDSGVRDSAMLDSIELFSRVRIQNGEFMPSREDLNDARRLVEKHPHSMVVWRMAIGLHVSAGMPGEAVRLAQQSAARLPQLAEPAQLAAELLAQQRRFDEALTMGQAWRQRSLHRPFEADVFIANVYLALARYADAASQLMPHLDRIKADRNERPQLMGAWLYAMLQSDRASEAAASLRPLFDETGPWRQTWIDTVGLVSDRRAARNALSVLTADDFNQADHLLMLAAAWSDVAYRFRSVEDFDRADNYAKQAAQRDSALAISSLLIRAQNADRAEKEQMAESLYRDVISLDSENVIAMNNLADVLVRSGRNCREASDLAAKASELAPGIPEIRDTRAHAMLCLDDLDAAERLARQAIELRPDSPHFLITLGLVQAQQGRIAEAGASLSQAEQLITQKALTANAVLQSRIDRLRKMLDQVASGA